MLWARNRTVALLIGSLLLATACSADQTAFQRQRQVAENGAEVMPFDLDRTTHRFQQLPDGGIQTVVADNPEDSRQVTLTQSHLEKEAQAFTRGDFGDPAAIHGSEMPGLQELEASYRLIQVTYSAAPAGGQIRYLSTDEQAVKALHDWFAAQLGDHGKHAEAG